MGAEPYLTIHVPPRDLGFELRATRLQRRRAEVRRMLCPRCAAEPGDQCTGRRGNHFERIDAAHRLEAARG